jgi:hypothetical protein
MSQLRSIFLKILRGKRSEKPFLGTNPVSGNETYATVRWPRFTGDGVIEGRAAQLNGPLLDRHGVVLLGR